MDVMMIGRVLVSALAICWAAASSAGKHFETGLHLPS